MLKVGKLEIKWLGHSGFRITNDKSIYIDPYILSSKDTNADLIIISHEHYDHCDKNKINQLIYEGTSIIASEGCEEKLLSLNDRMSNRIMILEEGREFNVDNIRVVAVPAYTIHKTNHPRGLGVGYLIYFEGKVLYFAGDTDMIPEMKLLREKNIDVAFLPIGGTYTMNAKEAAEAVKLIRPKIAVPMHYGKLVGSEKDAEDFRMYAGNICDVEIL